MSTSHFDVCHAWAHNDQRHLNGSRMSHRNGRLYSHGTCIGQRLEINNNVVFIVDVNHYSSSTSSHQRLMLSAIPECESHTFYFPYSTYGRGEFVSMYGINSLKKQLITIGFQMLAKEFYNCRAIQTIKTLDHGFSFKGYENMVRFFEVTGVTTVKSLLRMRSDEFNEFVRGAMYKDLYNPAPIQFAQKHFRKFLRLMSEGVKISVIVDAINGKASWEEYQSRVSKLKNIAKNRRLSDFVGYVSGTRCNMVKTYVGECFPVVYGSITKKDIDRHTKDGDLISWMLKTKRKNLQYAVDAHLSEQKRKRKSKAKENLEKFIGMSGFGLLNGVRIYNSNLSSFNYNGTVVSFSAPNKYSERHLSDKEYEEFVSSSNKSEWIFNKKNWMLEQLEEDRINYERAQSMEAEERRLLKMEREFCEQQLNRKEYIENLKSKGNEGWRQLFHEGFRISLPYENSDIFYGGNALLRINSIRNIVETSKGIRITIDECRRLWKVVSYWRTNTEKSEEKGFVIRSCESVYHVHSFDKDILTVGCHRIAYKEMQYIADQLGLNV